MPLKESLQIDKKQLRVLIKDNDFYTMIDNSEFSDLRDPEYQAVIVVDYDDGRLFPLTENTLKCLLPIANRKLLSYQLDMLAKSGIQETFIVVQEEYEKQLNQFLEEYVRLNMKIELIAIEEMSGSADGLRAVAERIRGDFFCLGSDFISQFSLNDLADLHRTSKSDATILFSVLPKDSAKDDVDQEIVAVGEEGRLLMKSPLLEIDETIEIHKALLNKSSSFRLRNDLFDMGIYLFSYWILEHVQNNKRISSIKSDLLPFLIDRQFQPRDYLLSSIPALEHRKRPLKSLEAWLTSGRSNIRGNKNLQTVFDFTPDSNEDMLRCFALVYDPSLLTPTTSGPNAVPPVYLLNRVTTIQSYLNFNKEVTQIQYSSRTPWQRISGYLKKELSVVGENTDLSDKTITIKQCFIGNNCQIGAKCKLNNCVVMDGAVIGENCIIQNSVICDRVIIENNCNLNECNVGSGYRIPINSKIRGDTFSLGSS